MWRQKCILFLCLAVFLGAVTLPFTTAQVTAFGCQRIDPKARKKPDEVFGESCAESVQKGIDFSQLGVEIVDGSTFLAESDSQCCQKCRETPGTFVRREVRGRFSCDEGCRSWSRFLESGGKGRPKNGCWLTAAKDADSAKSARGVHSGTVFPYVSKPSDCRVDFDNTGLEGVSYNQRELLHVEDPDECCLHCQEEAPLCTGWEYNKDDGTCGLFAGEPPRRICPSCVAKKINVSEIDPPKAVRGIIDTSCGTNSISGTEGTLMKGTPLEPREAFRRTESSTSCCRFCAMARECRAWSWEEITKECTLLGDIPADTIKGKDRDSSGIISPKVCGAPRFEVRAGVSFSSTSNREGGNGPVSNIPTSDAAECGLRCLEIPGCRAWTYTASLGDCFTVEKPALAVQACADCSSSIIKDRYATPEDKNLLRDIEKRVSAIADPPKTLQVSPDSPPSPSSSPSSPGDVGSLSDPDEGGGGGGGGGKSVKLGMVLGPIAAVIVLLLCIPAFFEYRKYKRDKTIKEHRDKLSSSPTAMQGLTTYPSGPSEGSTVQNQTAFRSDPLSQAEAKTGMDYLRYDSEPSLPGQMLEPSPEQVLQLQEVLKDSKQQGKIFDFRSMSSLKDRESVLDSVLLLEPGTVIANKYRIEPGTKIGQNNAIVRAVMMFGQATPVVFKFFKSKEEFERESSFYTNSVSSNFLPDVLDIYDGEGNEALGLPPLCGIVLERGDMSLGEWLDKQTSVMDHMDQRNVLYKIARGVQFLHDSRVVHRDLKPGNIVVFSSSLLALKLIDLGSACKRGDPAPIEYTLRYAAPEVVSAHLNGATSITAHPSADLWSLGLIFWEILVGEPMFGDKYTEEQVLISKVSKPFTNLLVFQVLAMLAGFSPLPFEQYPEMWGQIPQRAARRMVHALLHKHPESRWPIQKVLGNAFFSSGHDTVAHEEQVEVFSAKLQEIAEGVTQIKQGMIKLEAISLENLKLTASQALLACISFYDIDPSEITEQASGEYFVQRFQKHQLKCAEAPLEPNYNLFVQRLDEPTALLRIARRHLVRISLMTSGEVKVDVPISEVLWVKIWPTELEPDGQECKFFTVNNEGHCIEGLAYWDTVRHRDLALQLQGKTSVDVLIGFRLKGQQDVTVIQKTILLRMHPEKAQFRAVKAFHRTREFSNNLPQWAKVYIHGSVAIARLLMN